MRKRSGDSEFGYRSKPTRSLAKAKARAKRYSDFKARQLLAWGKKMIKDSGYMRFGSEVNKQNAMRLSRMTVSAISKEYYDNFTRRAFLKQKGRFIDPVAKSRWERITGYRIR